MNLKISFKCKDAIALNGETLKKLIALLDEQYPDSKSLIFASLENDTKIIFDNLEELLAYGNRGKEKIQNLVIGLDSVDKSNMR